MNGQRRPGLSTLLTAAAFGAVTGHSITYLLAVPDPGSRGIFLAATGHSYMPPVIPAALILGIFAALSTMIRHLGGDRVTDPAGGWGWGRTVGSLALLQCGIFFTQETLERIVIGAPAGTLLHHSVLALGMVVQFGVAAIVAVVLFVLRRTAEIAGASSSMRTYPPRADHTFLLPLPEPLRSRVWATVGSIRAPPTAIASAA